MQIHNANTGGTIEAQATVDTDVTHRTRNVKMTESGDIFITLEDEDNEFIDIHITKWNRVSVYGTQYPDGKPAQCEVQDLRGAVDQH